MNEVTQSSNYHARDDLQLYILGRLNAAQVDIVERHLSDCAECEEELARTARFVAQVINLKSKRSHSDNRLEPRFRACDTGVLRCFSPLFPDRWPIEIIDVSKNGLGLLVPTSLLLDALVQARIGDIFALGEVRYCKQINEHQFRVGIRILDLVQAGHAS